MVSEYKINLQMQYATMTYIYSILLFILNYETVSLVLVEAFSMP